MCFSTKDIMSLFGNDAKSRTEYGIVNLNDEDFKLADDSDKVDDTSTINKSEEDNSFNSNIKI